MPLNSNYFGFIGAGSSGGGSGTVTSVGLTMPSAFNVSNTPITTSGDIGVTGAGATSQYIRGDGSLANFPSSLGGGSSIIFYLNGGTSQGDFGGTTYYQMSQTAVVGTNADFNISSNGYIASFITDVGSPNQLTIPSGNWNFELFFSSSSSGNTPNFYLELYKYDGATFTLIASNSTNPEIITGGTAIDLYTTALAVPTTSLAPTDRLAVRVYVTNDGKTITLHTQDSHLCQVITTFSTGITALNGLTAQIQNFETGTSGTDFGISSASSTHTFNLPIASATNTGKLSNSDWATFNNKLSDDSVVLGQQALGSSVKSVGLACRTWGNITLQTALADGSIFLIAIYVSQSSTITGVKWWQNVQGVYTADNENRVGLYSYSGGTLTLVASSTDDGNLWKGASASVQSKAFTTPYVAPVGVYFIGLLYNSSAQTTAPQIGSAPNKLNGAVGDFTNSAKFNSSIASATLSASISMSGTSTTQGNWGAFLY